MKRVVTALVLATSVSACAEAPDKISASYVSPLQYSSYDCDQLSAEMQRVSAQVKEVAGVQQRKHNNDAIATGVGIVLFWPALFFLASGDKKEELSHLKGEYDAITETGIQKKCSFATTVESAEAAHPAKVGDPSVAPRVLGTEKGSVITTESGKAIQVEGPSH